MRGVELVLAVVLVAAAASCGSDPESTPTAEPTPTGSTCPPGSTLSYENFGADFMEAYCTRCHSSDLHGADRHGAPLYHDFDSLDGIIVIADHVDEWAAAGPDATNRLMPPDDGDAPSDEERLQLGEWLACELDKL